MKELYLVSNAHIDPVWQWQRDEGIGVTISTFTSAANILEESDTLIFNHNESALYAWVEKYVPELFKRIRKLVKQKKWFIAGGWYIQPDCNMPSGESIVRHILVGRTYFKEKFDAEPKVAVNYDSFGHSRGLVQILQDAGYIGYVCVRPQPALPVRDFVWEGLNGSKVFLHRATDGYNSFLGHVGDKLPFYYEQLKNNDREMLMWGVGNHGGGPSRQDLKFLDEEIAKNKQIHIHHATVDEYFLSMREEDLPHMQNDLNYFMQGCYTSQIRVKHTHKKLENDFFMTEKMCAHASLNGMEYPKQELDRIQEILLFSEFHDILPGSMVKEAEDASLNMMGGGLDALNNLKFQAFLNLANGYAPAAEGEIPIFLYNPHPYPVKKIVEAEFMLADQNRSLTEYYCPEVYHNGKFIPSQQEKESSNVPIDWRKKIVFEAELGPMSVERFCCFPKLKKVPQKEEKKKDFVFENERMRFVIDRNTGYPQSYCVDGKEFIRDLFVYVNQGSCDPWGFYFSNKVECRGRFSLMSEQEATEFSCCGKPLAPVRIIEDGEIRTVVEALFSFQGSRMVIRYLIPKHGSQVEFRIKIFNQEMDSVLKLGIFTPFSGKYFGKTCFGVMELPTDLTETVAQEWTRLDGEEGSLSVINFGNYGSHSDGSSIHMTLLNSAAYTAHPVDDRVILKQDRFTERMDMGERDFRFILNASDVESRIRDLEFENTVQQQAPYVMNYFPTEDGHPCNGIFTLDNKCVGVSAWKRAEKDKAYILRVYNLTSSVQKTVLRMPCFRIEEEISLKPDEFKSFRLSEEGVTPVNILEKPQEEKR